MKDQQSLIEWLKPKKKKTNFYNKRDLISYLIKSVRINDEKIAITIMRVMLSEWISEQYIARKMVHLASEDIVWKEYFVYAQSVHERIKLNGNEINSLSRLIIELCNAQKFWESELEADREFWRISIRERIKACYAKWEKPMELPSWIYDQYTAKGKAKMKKWEQYDLRYSGVKQGGVYLRKQYLELWKLDPQASSIEDWWSDEVMECISKDISYDQRLHDNE